ncbi:amidohydrolase family protein, partial [bacterium]|nr:amidohydrolase family protein [bacterium]
MYEACQAANGKRDSRHSIAHVEVLHPDDVQRFAELGVIADVHPAHIALASEKYEDNGYLVRLGKREKHCF